MNDRPSDNCEMAVVAISNIIEELAKPPSAPQPSEVPSNMVEGVLGMTNFDHTIDDGFESSLRTQAVWGRHAGWNFNGRVWFDGNEFCEEVWTYHVPREVVRASSLQELMRIVNEQYGTD